MIRGSVVALVVNATLRSGLGLKTGWYWPGRMVASRYGTNRK